MTAAQRTQIRRLNEQLRALQEPWESPDVRGMLQRKHEATMSANAGAYARPFGPVLRRTGSSVLPAVRELLKKLYGMDIA